MALEQRLLNRSRENGTSLVRLRKAVVFDRLLARLVVAAPDRWVLKGALALDYRLGPGTRTTRDIDLGRMDDENAATADFVVASTIDSGARRPGGLRPEAVGQTAICRGRRRGAIGGEHRGRCGGRAPCVRPQRWRSGAERSSRQLQRWPSQAARPICDLTSVAECAYGLLPWSGRSKRSALDLLELVTCDGTAVEQLLC
jgi:hypothetical protein